MLISYIKIALRNIVRFKLYSLINIIGLAVGVAVCLLIFIFVQNEMSYDTFHSNSDRIYKVIKEEGEVNVLKGVTPLPLYEALKTDFPELKVVQTKDMSNVVTYKDKIFTEDKFYYTNPDFFEIFSFHLSAGDPKTALANPNSVVITKDIAEKYFGNDNPLGRTFIVNNQETLTVTGVIEDIPKNSSIRFDFLAAMSSLVNNWGEWINDWHPCMFSTFILLPKDNSPESFSQNLKPFLQKYMGKDETKYQRLKLQPLRDIHLYSADIKFNDVDKAGDINEIYIFSTIAILILLLACINYMNLATSRYSNRMNEIGIRKFIGASRQQLIKQFLGESFITCLFAVIISVIIVELFLPTFNQLMNTELEMGIFNNVYIVIGLILFVISLALVSGSYPAIFLSSFNPIKILRSSVSPDTKNLVTRKILIVIQFTVAVTLIICIGVVFSQLNFIKNKNLGFEKENLVTINIPYQLRDKFSSYRNVVLENNNVRNIALVGEIPPNRLGTTNPIDILVNDQKKTFWFHVMDVDYDLIETMGLKIKEGRSFSRKFGADERESIIFNEAAVKYIGSPNILNKDVSYLDQTKRAIGVVEDFNYWTLHEKIEPVVIVLDKKGCWRILARINSNDTEKTIEFMKSKWATMFNGWPFEFTFVDENLNQLYNKEIKLEKLSEYFTVLSVFIACIGLLGLTAFTAQKRTKEIGIRKVLGASVSSIIKLLSHEFMVLVLIANIIAWPIAYYSMNKWLQNFAYRIDINIWMFILSGGIALLIAMVTVSFHAVKAATANPVDSLKYE